MQAGMSAEQYEKGIGRARDYYASEYHRLNMQVARAEGAKASVDLALARAREVKSTPKWMIAYLESAADRLPGISADLAVARDNCADAKTWKPT